MKVEALQSVNVNAHGQTVHMEAGNEYELPAEVANDMERAGFVRVIASAAEVKAALADEKPDAVTKRTPIKAKASKAK